MANNNSCNNFAPAQFIVNPTAGSGTHTTIGAAITAASSGQTIFIMPGTYTENPALKTGVNLVAYTGDGVEGTVIINGKCTYSSAGTVTISNIQLKTNSDNFLAVSGNAASIVNLMNCDLQCTNTTGISFTSSSGSANINIFYCTGNITTTGIAFYTSTSAGNITCLWSRIRNDGASSTASSNSASTMYFRWCDLYFPFSTSSTGNVDLEHCSLNSGGNTTLLTTAGTGSANIIQYCHCFSGSASTLSIGTGTTIEVLNSDFQSSNTNAITGAGTITINGIQYTGSSSTNNVSIQTYNRSQGYSNLQFLSTLTASNSATISFTSVITSLYDTYYLFFDNVFPVTNTALLSMQISTNNGSSYIATNYNSCTVKSPVNSLTQVLTNLTTAYRLSYGLSSTTTNGPLSGYIVLQNFQNSSLPTVCGMATGFSTGDSTLDFEFIFGNNTANSNPNAIQLSMSSGNISTGKFSLYGVIQ